MKRLFRTTYCNHLSGILLLSFIMSACYDDARMPPPSMKKTDLKENQDHSESSAHTPTQSESKKASPTIPILPNAAHAATHEHSADSIPVAERVMIISNGAERYMSASKAKELGYQIIDFRYYWTFLNE